MNKGWKGDHHNLDLWGGPKKPSKDHYFEYATTSAPTYPSNWVQNGKIVMSLVHDAIEGCDRSHPVNNEPHPSTSADRYYEEIKRRESVRSQEKENEKKMKSEPKWPTFTKDKDIIATEEKFMRHSEISRMGNQLNKPGLDNSDPKSSNDNIRQQNFDQMTRILENMPQEKVDQLITNIKEDAMNHNLSVEDYIHRRAHNLPLDASVRIQADNTYTVPINDENVNIPSNTLRLRMPATSQQLATETSIQQECPARQTTAAMFPELTTEARFAGYRTDDYPNPNHPGFESPYPNTQQAPPVQQTSIPVFPERTTGARFAGYRTDDYPNPNHPGFESPYSNTQQAPPVQQTSTLVFPERTTGARFAGYRTDDYPNPNHPGFESPYPNTQQAPPVRQTTTSVFPERTTGARFAGYRTDDYPNPNHPGFESPYPNTQQAPPTGRHPGYQSLDDSVRHISRPTTQTNASRNSSKQRNKGNQSLQTKVRVLKDQCGKALSSLLAQRTPPGKTTRKSQADSERGRNTTNTNVSDHNTHRAPSTTMRNQTADDIGRVQAPAPSRCEPDYLPSESERGRNRIDTCIPDQVKHRTPSTIAQSHPRDSDEGRVQAPVPSRRKQASFPSCNTARCSQADSQRGRNRTNTYIPDEITHCTPSTMTRHQPKDSGVEHAQAQVPSRSDQATLPLGNTTRCSQAYSERGRNRIDSYIPDHVTHRTPSTMTRRQPKDGEIGREQGPGSSRCANGTARVDDTVRVLPGPDAYRQCPSNVRPDQEGGSLGFLFTGGEGVQGITLRELVDEVLNPRGDFSERMADNYLLHLRNRINRSVQIYSSINAAELSRPIIPRSVSTRRSRFYLMLVCYRVEGVRHFSLILFDLKTKRAQPFNSPSSIFWNNAPLLRDIHAQYVIPFVSKVLRQSGVMQWQTVPYTLSELPELRRSDSNGISVLRYAQNILLNPEYPSFPDAINNNQERQKIAVDILSHSITGQRILGQTDGTLRSLKNEVLKAARHEDHVLSIEKAKKIRDDIRLRRHWDYENNAKNDEQGPKPDEPAVAKSKHETLETHRSNNIEVHDSANETDAHEVPKASKTRSTTNRWTDETQTDQKLEDCSKGFVLQQPLNDVDFKTHGSKLTVGEQTKSQSQFGREQTSSQTPFEDVPGDHATVGSSNEKIQKNTLVGANQTQSVHQFDKLREGPKSSCSSKPQTGVLPTASNDNDDVLSVTSKISNESITTSKELPDPVMTANAQASSVPLLELQGPSAINSNESYTFGTANDRVTAADIAYDLLTPETQMSEPVVDNSILQMRDRINPHVGVLTAGDAQLLAHGLAPVLDPISASNNYITQFVDGGHWFFYHFDVNRRRVISYNSLNTILSAERKRDLEERFIKPMLNHLRSLQGESDEFFAPTDDWLIEYYEEPDLPQQPGHFECGAFVIKFAESVLESTLTGASPRFPVSVNNRAARYEIAIDMLGTTKFGRFILQESNLDRRELIRLLRDRQTQQRYLESKRALRHSPEDNAKQICTDFFHEAKLKPMSSIKPTKITSVDEAFRKLKSIVNKWTYEPASHLFELKQSVPGSLKGLVYNEINPLMFDDIFMAVSHAMSGTINNHILLRALVLHEYITNSKFYDEWFNTENENALQHIFRATAGSTKLLDIVSRAIDRQVFLLTTVLDNSWTFASSFWPRTYENKTPVLIELTNQKLRPLFMKHRTTPIAFYNRISIKSFDVYECRRANEDLRVPLCYYSDDNVKAECLPILNAVNKNFDWFCQSCKNFKISACSHHEMDQLNLSEKLRKILDDPRTGDLTSEHFNEHTLAETATKRLPDDLKDYVLASVIGDGNCFWSAVSIALIGDAILGADLRRATLWSYMANREIDVKVLRNYTQTDILRRLLFDIAFANVPLFWLASRLINRTINVIDRQYGLHDCFYRHPEVSGELPPINLWLHKRHFSVLIPKHNNTIRIPVNHTQPDLRYDATGRWIKLPSSSRTTAAMPECVTIEDTKSSNLLISKETEPKPNRSNIPTTISASHSNVQIRSQQTVPDTTVPGPPNLSGNIVDAGTTTKDHHSISPPNIAIITTTTDEHKQIPKQPLSADPLAQVDEPGRSKKHKHTDHFHTMVEFSRAILIGDASRQSILNVIDMFLLRNMKLAKDFIARSTRKHKSAKEINVIATGSLHLQRYQENQDIVRQMLKSANCPCDLLELYSREVAPKMSKLFPAHCRLLKTKNILPTDNVNEKSETLEDCKQNTSESPQNPNTTTSDQRINSATEAVSFSQADAHVSDKPKDTEKYDIDEDVAAMSTSNANDTNDLGDSKKTPIPTSSLLHLIIPRDAYCLFFNEKTGGLLEGSYPAVISKAMKSKIACDFLSRTKPTIYRITKTKGSRRRWGKVLGYCHCGLKFRGELPSKPKPDIPTDIKIIVSGTQTSFLHNTYIGRPIRGLQRVDMRRRLKNISAYRARVTDASKARNTQAFQHGTTVPPLNTYAKIKHEGVKKKRRSQKPRNDLDLLKRYWKKRVNPDKSPSGFVQTLDTNNDLKIHLFTYDSVHLLQTQRRKQKNITLHVDATGGIFKQDKKEKRALLYLAIVKTDDGITWPLAEMVNQTGKVREISYWFSCIKDHVCTTKSIADLVVCDFSYAILHATLNAFNTESIDNYIQRCFGHFCGAIEWPESKVFVCLCIAHLMNGFKKNLAGKLSSHVQNRKQKIDMALFGLARLQELMSLEEFDQLTEVIVKTFGMQQINPVELEENKKILMRRLDDFDPNELPEVEEDEMPLPDDYEELLNGDSIRERSKFHDRFRVVRQRVEKEHSSQSNNPELAQRMSENELYCPEVIEIIQQTYIGVFPLWNNNVIRRFHSMDFLRETSAVVESEFRTKKRHWKEGKYPNYADFVRDDFLYHTGRVALAERGLREAVANRAPRNNRRHLVNPLTKKGKARRPQSKRLTTKSNPSPAINLQFLIENHNNRQHYDNDSNNTSSLNLNVEHKSEDHQSSSHARHHDSASAPEQAEEQWSKRGTWDGLPGSQSSVYLSGKVSSSKLEADTSMGCKEFPTSSGPPNITAIPNFEPTNCDPCSPAQPGLMESDTNQSDSEECNIRPGIHKFSLEDVNHWFALVPIVADEKFRIEVADANAVTFNNGKWLLNYNLLRRTPTATCHLVPFNMMKCLLLAYIHEKGIMFYDFEEGNAGREELLDSSNIIAEFVVPYLLFTGATLKDLCRDMEVAFAKVPIEILALKDAMVVTMIYGEMILGSKDGEIYQDCDFNLSSQRSRILRSLRKSEYEERD